MSRGRLRQSYSRHCLDRRPSGSRCMSEPRLYLIEWRNVIKHMLYTRRNGLPSGRGRLELLYGKKREWEKQAVLAAPRSSSSRSRGFEVPSLSGGLNQEWKI